MDWTAIKDTVINWSLGTGIKIIISLIVLIISFKVINSIAKKLQKKNEASGKLDVTIFRTLCYAGKIVLKCLVVICLVAYLGIDTSGLTALVASLGVCFGLAVNGALANLAGGVLILVTRPFKIGDYIEVAGYAGTVEEIRIVTTKIVTVDNKVVYVPNSVASSSIVVNYSEKELRRVDQTFSIAYSADFRKAEEVIKELIANNELALKDPAPMVRVSAHNDSSIDIVSRIWVKGSDYWTVYFAMLEDVKTAFDKNNIEIPFPQVDVHVKND